MQKYRIRNEGFSKNCKIINYEFKIPLKTTLHPRNRDLLLLSDHFHNNILKLRTLNETNQADHRNSKVYRHAVKIENYKVKKQVI